MTLLFEEFCRKYGLKNASTSSDEIYKVVKELGLKDFGIYTDDQKLKTKCGLINLDEKGKVLIGFVIMRIIILTRLVDHHLRTLTDSLVRYMYIVHIKFRA